MTKDDLDLSGAYALDAVTPAEREAYEHVLESSDTARAEATELQDTAVMLGLSAAPVEPPAALRSALLAQIAVTPQLAAVPKPVTGIAPVVAKETGAASRKAESRWFQRPAIAIAGIAAAVSLVAGGIAFGDSLLSPPQQSTEASALEQLTLADDRAELVSDVAGGGVATMRYSAELGISAVSVSGAEDLGDDRTYQLWYIGEDGARPAGFLPADRRDDSWVLLDGTMSAGDAVGITVEPKGGSEIPTTTPVVVLTA